MKNVLKNSESTKNINNMTLKDDEYRNIMINNDIELIIQKNNCGYIIDVYDSKENHLDSMTIWEDDYNS